MVESSLCPACSSAVLAGQAYCPTCGAPQATDAASNAGTPEAARPSGEPTMPDWALRPSSESSMPRPDGPSMSVSVGAIPVSSVGGKAVLPNAAAAPFAAPAPPRSPFAAPISRPVPPVAVPQSPAKPAQKESTQELVAFGLTAAGAVMGAASQFLPWTGVVGMGIGTTISQLVDMLLELTGSALKPEYLPQEQSFVTHRIGSTEKAIKLLGFKASTPLLEGLRQVVDWRKSQTR